MNAYILIAAAIVAIAAAGTWDHHEEHYIDYNSHPHYHFDYSVHDPHTHDQKYQWETRDGEHVKGTYSLVQPDHKTRTVKYNADKHGFNAEVKYEAHGHSVYQRIGSGFDGEHGDY